MMIYLSAYFIIDPSKRKSAGMSSSMPVKSGSAQHPTRKGKVKIMKATGITRRIDELGRIVLPIELRRGLDIGEKDALEIYVEDDTIILKKFKKSCIFCNNDDNIIDFKGKNVCSECIAQLKK